MNSKYSRLTEEILSAIEAELEATAQYVDFKVLRAEKEGDIWKVYVDLTDESASGLDESLEGSTAWWVGPPKGGADVLSVIPESEQINLRFATTQPPTGGKLVRLYPPRYLDALHDCWSRNWWANQCLIWLDEIGISNSFDQSQVISIGPYKWLRKNQVESFKLLGWKASFLWGPPGTGKTTTLGAMLARYLIQFPNRKVLLFSTTNSAVDQSLIAVDKVLEQTGSSAASVRKKCFRIGNHFIAGNYKGREHLLPVQDKTLIQRLAELEARRPRPEEVLAFTQWKTGIEQIRSEIRRQSAHVLDLARFGAMTTTRAVFTFKELLDRSPYDLIAFDEASQVGLAHALALAPLARKCLFAGDPKQLSPIVKSEHKLAQSWLSQSMFSRMDESEGSACLLNEQSRMSEEICRIVSNVFYNGKLIVAEDCKKDPEWNTYRKLPSVHPVGNKSVCLEATEGNGTWSHKYHGPIRYESADHICGLVCNLTEMMDESDILILTPFRAQRTLIRTFLRNSGVKRVTVSTVHRAQGSERHTVIFDPAMGTSPFLKKPEATRLINVALSRAQARLVVILSYSDRGNPLLDQIANCVTTGPPSKAIPISQLVSLKDFPYCAVGKVVQIRDTFGQITGVLDGGEYIMLLDLNNGSTRKFKTSVIKERFGKGKSK